MPLEHRHIDQEIDLIHRVNDIELHTGAVDLMPFVFLSVYKGHIVFFAQFFVAAVYKRLRSAVSDPGALHNNNILKLIFLQIFHNSGNYLGVRGCAEFRRRGDHQIRLYGDPFLSAPDQTREIHFGE